MMVFIRLEMMSMMILTTLTLKPINPDLDPLKMQVVVQLLVLLAMAVQYNRATTPEAIPMIAKKTI